jgi:hypothetical protein
MNKIVFDFAGMPIEVDSSISLEMMVLKDGAKFRFNGDYYVVEELTAVGIEEQAENDEKRHQLLKDPSFKGECPGDVIDLHVRLRKV